MLEIINFRRLAMIIIGSFLHLNGVPGQTLELEEITVTAQSHAKNQQDIPISINTISGKKLSSGNITNIESMATLVPNLLMTQSGIGTVISIRGISSGINQGFEQSVGQYVDSIYYGRAQLARAPLVDIERVEILRGPQSILFGKNSIAGAISTTTAKPTREIENTLSLIYEPEHNEQDLRFVVSGPINKTLNARLSLLKRSMDGYFTNTTLNRNEAEEDTQLIRGIFQWVPNSDWQVSLKMETSAFNTQGRYIDVLHPQTIGNALSYAESLSILSKQTYQLDTQQNFLRQSNGDYSYNDTDNITLISKHIIDDHTLVLTSGFNTYQYQEKCDCDFVGAIIFDIDTVESFDQFSQEFRYLSTPDSDIEYIAGLFYQSNKLEYDDSINFPVNSLLPEALKYNKAFEQFADSMPGTATQRSFEQKTQTFAAFLQSTWVLPAHSQLTLGGRFTHENKKASRRQRHINSNGQVALPSENDLQALYGLLKFESYNNIYGKRSESHFTPLINFQYDLNENSMLYLSYTSGFKSGGFDVRSNAHPDDDVGIKSLKGVFEYEEEQASSYETGGKFLFSENKAEVNLAFFKTRYENLQTSQFDGGLGFNVTNAGKATIYGLEVEGRWQANEHFFVTGAFANLAFEYDKFPNAQCYFGQPPNSSGPSDLCDLEGKSREFAPETQASLSMEYAHSLLGPVDILASAELIYSNDYFASPTLDPRLKQQAHTKMNARIAISSVNQHWEIALIGKNLTDEKILIAGSTLPMSPIITQSMSDTQNPSTGMSTAYYAFYEQPRNLALQLTLQY